MTPTADSESSVWGRKQTSLNRVLHVSFSARRLTGPWSPIADDSGVPPPQLYWRMTDTWDCADEAIFLGKFGNTFGELLKQVYQAQADAGWKSSVVISELGEKREVTATPGFSVDSSKARQQGLDRQRCEAQKWLQRTTKEDNRYMTIPEGGDAAKEGGGGNSMALECSKEQGPGWRGCWLEGYQDASLPLSLPLPSPSSKKYFF